MGATVRFYAQKCHVAIEVGVVKLILNGRGRPYVRMPSSKIKSRRVCRRAIRENFNLRKFLAIRYFLLSNQT